jgi:hypothetical protein
MTLLFEHHQHIQVTHRSSTEARVCTPKHCSCFIPCMGSADFFVGSTAGAAALPPRVRQPCGRVHRVSGACPSIQGYRLSFQWSRQGLHVCLSTCLLVNHSVDARARMHSLSHHRIISAAGPGPGPDPLHRGAASAHCSAQHCLLATEQAGCVCSLTC